MNIHEMKRLEQAQVLTVRTAKEALAFARARADMHEPGSPERACAESSRWEAEEDLVEAEARLAETRDLIATLGGDAL